MPSAYSRQALPTLRCTRTSGLSVKFDPPFQVNRATPKRSTSGGWVTGSALPPSSGSRAS